VLHRLHPLVKVLWLLWGTLFVFIVRDPKVVVIVLGLALASFSWAGLPLLQVRGMRLFFTTALVLGLLQVIFVREGAVLLEAGLLRVTLAGLASGIYVAGRFLCVILLSYLFVMTTDPNDLAYSLMRVGLPYRYGFALITALRLVPVFEQEGQIVYNAQLARGVRYDVRGLRHEPGRFLTLARQFFLPLLVSALSKVDALAVSMEGRCFGKYPSRTFLREVYPSRLDWFAVILLGVGLLVTLMLKV